MMMYRYPLEPEIERIFYFHIRKYACVYLLSQVCYADKYLVLQ